MIFKSYNVCVEGCQTLPLLLQESDTPIQIAFLWGPCGFLVPWDNRTVSGEVRLSNIAKMDVFHFLTDSTDLLELYLCMKLLNIQSMCVSVWVCKVRIIP